MNNRYNFALADPANYALLKEKAIYNRQHPTDAERIVRQSLKGKLPSVRFRNQYVIGNYIVDFVALKQRLIIEIDGEYHSDKTQSEDDMQREMWLKAQGFKIIRFTNEEVFNEIQTVMRGVVAEIR